MSRIVLPNRLNGEKCRLSPKRASIVSVLDVGSTKIACLIARLTPQEGEQVLACRTHAIEVLGYGYQRARGVKSAVVVDLEAAEHAVRRAVDAAERMAGVTVDSLIVSQTCGRLQSDIFSAEVELSGDKVSEHDIRRVLRSGSARAVESGRTTVHALPIGYRLDEQAGVRDPLDMVAERLGVDIHCVTADASAQHNLALCVGRCHLDVEAMVATPYASGLATLVDDEAELGAVVIDIGGGTSSVGMFVEGQLVHVDSVPVGSHHVTLDIANGLAVGLEDAERLKVLNGSALVTGSDDRDQMTIHPIGERDAAGQLISRALLNRIIRPRVEEILELVRDRIAASGFAGKIGRRIVLTGGGSQLTGLTTVAGGILGRSVRLGRPLGVGGLPEAAKGPAFSAVVGLLIYPQLAPFNVAGGDVGGPSMMAASALARVGRWLRESF